MRGFQQICVINPTHDKIAISAKFWSKNGHLVILLKFKMLIFSAVSEAKVYLQCVVDSKNSSLIDPNHALTAIWQGVHIGWRGDMDW